MRSLFVPDPLYPDRTQYSFFHEGEFLTIVQTVQALEPYQQSENPDMLAKYRAACARIREMLLLYQALPTKQFPVVRLRHVTIEHGFRGIMEYGKIDGSCRTFLLNGVERSLCVSCWGVHIPPKKLEAYRKKRFAQFMQLAAERGLTWNPSPEASAELRDMLANSPAMREDSRYGNFQFSFSTKDLLAMYQDQHCGGRKPVLRVLGTAAYKQELVHWILVHSPAWKDFDHLPTMDPSGPFSRDGNLMWAPESMTDQFTWQIDPSSRALEKKLISKKQQMQTYDAWIWSNAVFAFYLPNGRAIQIKHHRLLENVQACDTAPGVPRHPDYLYVPKGQAQLIIETEKRWPRNRR